MFGKKKRDAKQQDKKLVLERKTLRSLDKTDLAQVAGGLFVSRGRGTVEG